MKETILKVLLGLFLALTAGHSKELRSKCSQISYYFKTFIYNFAVSGENRKLEPINMFFFMIFSFGK